MADPRELRRALREAKKRWRVAECACGDRHDPFWMKCPRALAERDVADALAALGVEL